MEKEAKERLVCSLYFSTVLTFHTDTIKYYAILFKCLQKGARTAYETERKWQIW